MITLRDYQQEALSDLYNYICNNPGKNPVVSASVGAGKSIMIAKFCEGLKKNWPHLKILNLVHTKELISQNYEKFRSMRTGISSSVYSASLNQKSTRGDVVYGGIQSIYRNENPIHWDVIMVDEVHLISKKAENGMYRKYIDFCKKINPKLVVIGWTGTPWRMDGGSIVDGSERLFDDIVVDISIRQLLDKGFLSPLVLPSKKIETKFDTSNIKTSGNDFNQDALASVMDDEYLTRLAVQEYMDLSSDRNCHLIFGSSIDHCYHLKDRFSKYMDCEVVHGGLNPADRDKFIKGHQSNKLKMLINLGVLTTGYDCPQIDSIGLFRATKSIPLYIQIAGRGLRLADGKENCLWVDFTDTTERLGPVDDVQPPPTKGDSAPGEAPIKQCWNCENPVPASLSQCPHCGSLFDMQTSPNHGTEASTADILKEVKDPEWFNVTEMVIRKHHKKSTGNKSLCCTYLCGINQFKEWVMTQRDMHNGRFAQWWIDRGGAVPVPAIVDDAIKRKEELRAPSKIKVDRNGQYDSILEYEF